MNEVLSFAGSIFKWAIYVLIFFGLLCLVFNFKSLTGKGIVDQRGKDKAELKDFTKDSEEEEKA